MRDVEFRVLRDTIAWRGTVRMALVPMVLLGWALIWTLLVVNGRTGFSIVVPLVVLAGGWEAVYALHVGVERIGRYLQVAYEGPDGPLWESTAMRLGPGLPGGGVDPLFTRAFALAAAANLLPAVPRTAGQVFWFLIALAIHGVFVARLLRARRAAARQRALDLESMRTVRQELTRTT